MTQLGMVMVTVYLTAPNWQWHVVPVLFPTIDRARDFTRDIKILADFVGWNATFSYYHFVDSEEYCEKH